MPTPDLATATEQTRASMDRALADLAAARHRSAEVHGLAERLRVLRAEVLQILRTHHRRNDDR